MWLSGFIIGLSGSLHCLGMCGPIALAIPTGSGTKFQKWMLRLTYHTGRILAYTLIGFLFGTLGQAFEMTGFQSALSIAAGVFLLTAVWFPKIFEKLGWRSILFPFQSKVSAVMAQILKKRRVESLLVLGFLNGLLPCGMVYIAVVASIVVSDPIQGALLMASFGVGTLPLMLGVTGFITDSLQGVKKYLPRVAPFIAFAFAVYFILRGLGVEWAHVHFTGAASPALCTP